jgi:hypothetical protein
VYLAGAELAVASGRALGEVQSWCAREIVRRIQLQESARG